MVVRGESHTIRFNNLCGKGTPQLVIGGKVLSNGSDWTSDGPAQSGIAYLQTGPCWLNGEQCAIVEFNLNNPGCPGCGSSTDISLISPHALNVPTGFSYYNGCDGQGATCTTPDCNTAFHNSNDNQVQVACQTNNVDLLITFCPSGAQADVYAAPSPATSVPVVQAYAVPTSASPSHTSSLAPYVSEPSPVVPPPVESGIVPNSGSSLHTSPPTPYVPPPAESGVDPTPALLPMRQTPLHMFPSPVPLYHLRRNRE
ncbi:hypothetical protein BJV74DRAFT_773875 [Russula compacta]|nr:hypothetical protein BJV74DRAFT_773875 [Russula compacta]